MQHVGLAVAIRGWDKPANCIVVEQAFVSVFGMYWRWSLNTLGDMVGCIAGTSLPVLLTALALVQQKT